MPAFLRALLHDVMMVGVAMGMTSEEPITHLDLVHRSVGTGRITPAEHLLVMTLPGSYLDSSRGSIMRPAAHCNWTAGPAQVGG